MNRERKIIEIVFFYMAIKISCNIPFLEIKLKILNNGNVSIGVLFDLKCIECMAMRLISLVALIYFNEIERDSFKL